MTFRKLKKILLLLPILTLVFLFINYFENGATLRDSRVLLKDFLMLPDPLISENLEIGSEWKTLTPPKPLDSYYRVHEVHVYSKDILTLHVEPKYEEFDKSDQPELIHLEDGSTAKVEVILYNDQGREYPLEMGSIGGKVVAFGKARSQEDIIALSEKRTPDFPYDRKYTSLKIRCDIPLRIEKITWSMYRQTPWIISPIALYKQAIKNLE